MNSVGGTEGLPRGWRWAGQSEIFSIRGGAQPPASEFSNSAGPGLVRLIQIRDYQSDQKITFVPDSSKLRKCTREDVMIARYGSSSGKADSLGRVCRGIEGAYNVALVKAMPSNIVERDFLFYLLQSDYFQVPLRGQGARSVQSGFNKEGLATILLPHPPIEEQRRIAGVLGALDDLIEVNRGLMSGIEELLSARFSAFGFDEPGEALLGDLIEVNPVRAKPKGDAAYIDMAALSETQAGIDRVARRPAAGGARFTNGDTVMARITPCLENGKIGYVDCLQDEEVGVGSTEFIVLRSPAPFPLPWSYLLARSPRFRDHVIRHMTGTSGRQRCPADVVLGYGIKSPRLEDLNAFGGLANPLFEALRELRVENQELSGARDELLPLLMSGRIRVSEESVALQ
jgi:type I restriction enzyme S subunit